MMAVSGMLLRSLRKVCTTVFQNHRAMFIQFDGFHSLFEKSTDFGLEHLQRKKKQMIGSSLSVQFFFNTIKNYVTPRLPSLKRVKDSR
jgi:hypothetical protein